MRRMVSMDSTVVAIRDQISCDLAGETAVLQVATGTYYGLDAIGARIWTLLQEPRPVATMRDMLLSEYDVTPEACERDLLALLQELAAARLVEVMPSG